MSVPCGQCVGCRLERSRQWAVRCEHEISLHEHNCFVTLTYDDNNLPVDESLSLPDIQKFNKRLRKKFGAGIKIFYAGEYGDINRRPHYHSILFNMNFPDRKPFKRLGSGFTIDQSAILSELWPFGFSSIGAATFESAAYVARYCLKKVTGEASAEHYKHVTRYGELVDLVPEFAHMSKGIGAEWLKRHCSDVYPADRVVSRGGRVGRPPRYYAKYFASVNPMMSDELKEQRALSGIAEAWNNTPQRLAVREQVKQAQLRHLRRS